MLFPKVIEMKFVPIRYRFQLELSSSCLVRNMKDMFSLYNKVLTKPNFKYPSRIESILSDIALNEGNSVVDSGHRYFPGFSTLMAKDDI